MLEKIPGLKNLKSRIPGSGTSDPSTGALKTTPWRWRDADAVYVGWNADVWMYRELTLNPMMWEDANTRLALSAPLEHLLADLGSTSQDLGGGMASLSRNREIHVVSITYEAEARPPEGTPQALADYLEATLDFLVPTRVLLVGVKLRSSLASAVAGRSAGKSTFDAVKAQLTQTLGEDVPDLDAYEADRTLVRTIMEANGAGKVPSREVLAQLEAWYNLGRTTDVTILEAKDCLYIGDVDRIEIAAVTNFDQTQFTAPYATWLLDAMTHPEGASVVSVRAEMQPSSVAKSRIRRGQRKILAQMDEEAATGDLERPEHQSTLQSLRGAEDFLASTREVILTNCSMLLARRVTPEVTETYMDELGDVYGIELKPLEHRQLWALEETLPCSVRRVNPFVQDMTIGMLAYAGLQGYSNLGDQAGVFTGLVDPDYIPAYLNPLGAPANDLPPGMLIAGDPGSGKAQPLDAKILTPTGWSTMGEMTPGAEVIGSDGAPHQVLAVYPQGVRPIMRVTFTDGSSTECDEDHLWAVRTSNDAAAGRPWRTLTTTELAESIRDGQGKLRWRVPVTAPVQHPERELPEEPYLFGASVKASHEKHIPGEYLRSSVEQRVALLQGLMDTDGSVENGYPTFCSTSSDLTEVFIELIRSLGGTAKATPRPAHQPGRGPVPASWRVTLRLPADIVPFRLQRKLDRMNRVQPTPTRIVASVEASREAEAQCILVDADDHLYVTDDHIVTHNTFLCQMIALQCAIAGMSTIFINPKGFDTLAPFAQVVDGDVISMSSLERSGGAFDPFRYADPEQAAEIATSHILSVLGNVGTAGMGFNTSQEIKLGAGLRRGAIAGARCVNDALNYVDDKEVQHLVRELAGANSTFALGISMTPQEPFESRNRLTLIEFDRPLDLPEKGVQPSNYSQAQKISIAAMRLVTRASLHILANANGGVLIVDEAWTFLSNQEGLSVLQSMGRLGRSQNILPVFATQRVDDLLREGVDMEGYLSRVFVMKLADEREARAALKLCGLEATDQRIAWLRSAGPRRGEDGTPARPALALHRDLKGRHSAMMIGPVPDTARAAFTTNPEDRARIRRERERAAQQLPPDQEGQETL